MENVKVRDIKLLENEFEGGGEVKGMKFSQIKRTELSYLYEVNNDGQIHYEIIKRLISPVCIDFEKRLFSETEFKEIYPKSNKFGTDAICISGSKESAIIKFYEFSGELFLNDENLHS